MKEFILGRNPVYESLRAKRRHVFNLLLAKGVEPSPRLDEILNLVKERRLKPEQVARRTLDEMGEGHQGVALEVSAYQYSTLADILDLAAARQQPLFVLVLDMIQNPQNLGSLLRTAEAAGVHGVVIPLARAAGVTPAVVHASAGASEHLLVAPANLAQALEQLKQAGAWVLGLDGGPGSQPISEATLTGPLALVVGNEGEGMRTLVRKNCDLLVRLPMNGKIESLNAAVAGSVALYLALGQRGK
jgi:23S rRNA (guanosine2251-2'-O)-methyltransferase